MKRQNSIYDEEKIIARLLALLNWRKLLKWFLLILKIVVAVPIAIVIIVPLLTFFWPIILAMILINKINDFLWHPLPQPNNSIDAWPDGLILLSVFVANIFWAIYLWKQLQDFILNNYALIQW